MFRQIQSRSFLPIAIAFSFKMSGTATKKMDDLKMSLDAHSFSRLYQVKIPSYMYAFVHITYCHRVINQND